MASQPTHPHTPDVTTLREAKTLTGINYQTIHDAPIAEHIKWAHYNTAPTFRASRRDTIAWTANQKAP